MTMDYGSGIAWALVALGGAILGYFGGQSKDRSKDDREATSESSEPIVDVLEKFFHPTALHDLAVLHRQFPARLRADLDPALQSLVERDFPGAMCLGLHRLYEDSDVRLSDCLTDNLDARIVRAPLGYEEIDIGESRPVRVLRTGLWLAEGHGHKFAILTAPAVRYGEIVGRVVQIAGPAPEVECLADTLFSELEAAAQKSRSYRGKVLSLEASGVPLTGEGVGIQVHRLPAVQRDQVILPPRTLELLDRNIIQFVKQRPRLAALGQATKKGLLFYGPPGTGKTFTIRYLMDALPDHTTLLITAEQVGMLAEYLKLARFLQPSIVVIEDSDLIGRDRTARSDICEEALLNKLLNEMDGLVATTDVLFILTTNRPESLEAALASRPGRIDQAIEFPLPDEACRRKLVALYAGSAQVGDELAAEIVARTVGVSAAFIKELMRRAIQFQLERDGDGPLVQADIDAALDELLVRGGSLNRALLGAATVDRDA